MKGVSSMTPPSLIKGTGNAGKRGAKPLSKGSSPSPLKERGKNGKDRVDR